MTRIVATTPWSTADKELIDDARLSVVLPNFTWLGYPDTGVFTSQAELRDEGRRQAEETGGDWWLQLDADERLVQGETLALTLDDWYARAYPLPRLEEDGSISVCPYKLVRLPCQLVQGCDHFTWPGEDVVWRMSLQYSAHENLREYLLAGPYLIHQPSLRPEGTLRLGRVEDRERRPDDAVQWAEVRARKLTKGDRTMSGEGKYYCPGCGQRFEVAGVCTGTDESGHEPINVQPVSAGPVELEQAAPETRTGDEEPLLKAAKPTRKPAPKKKAPAKRKTSTTARRRKS
jgi:hypothetical protein